MLDLNKNIQYIKGVGPARVKLLNKLGIYTLNDIINYYPRTYEDRSKTKKLSDVYDGEEILIIAKVITKLVVRKIRKGLTIYKVIVSDNSNNCEITWYNQEYIKERIRQGNTYKFYGKVSNKYGKLEMNTPIVEDINVSKNTGKIVPIYSLTNNLTQNVLRAIVENAIKEISGRIVETLPDYILKEYNLCNLEYAIKKIHFPNNFSEYNIARKRLAFEEIMIMQLLLMKLKKNYNNELNGIQFDKNIKMSDVINDLPYKLTKAQLRVLEEIDSDMESKKCMNRLLQGDVGSGKTVVSIIASYKAVKSGMQVAIMAPTAILASQHLEEFNKILSKYDIKCELLISSITKKNKNEILEKLKNGEIDIIIGTHALLEENVVFNKLGLVVTDEQHRFGVKQREKIISKGTNPDTIVMTATPIPRTLALILYADLDISIIDELPPNRKKIDTFAVTKSLENRVNNFIKKQINEGRQVYVVCPLVEESEEINAKSVLELAEKYKNEIFKDYKVEYLHGKMKAKEKDEIMEEFKKGNIDILISTTVIEVGVNVPNASIMVVENAERFGLAQLHQLRGRVGRGEYKSYCILKYQGNSDVIRQRMKIMQDTNDGFVISEKDLELRGSGEFFGTKQHGLPEFKIANIYQDMEMLKSIQSIAIKILNEDPELKLEKNIRFKKIIDSKLKERIDL